MNKKYLLPAFIFLFVGVRFLKTEEVTSTQSYSGKITKIAQSKPVEQTSIQTEASRLPAQVNTIQDDKPSPSHLKKLQALKKSTPEEHNTEEYGLDESFKDLPRGMIYASSLRAVAKNDFSTSFGTIIREQGNMIYFKPHSEASDESWSNVVYDKRTSKVYPLSTVVKVFNIGDNQRSDLIAKGLDEYYYHESLQLFYTQSSNSKVISLITELKKMGYEIELEVVKDAVQKR